MIVPHCETVRNGRANSLTDAASQELHLRLQCCQGAAVAGVPVRFAALLTCALPMSLPSTWLVPFTNFSLRCETVSAPQVELPEGATDVTTEVPFEVDLSFHPK